ncbi:MAG: hypothetical protein L3J93_00350 [Thermoplasmata archaeon]|nr:hypothetical protein [Thermoplasmata archaeon]
MSASPGTPGPARACSGCSGPLSALGAQPIRTGGVAGHPDSVLWLAAYWCPRCGKVEFYTVG